MGSKENEVVSFLEPEASGFVYDTARSFLQRHASSESILSQLKNLIAHGELGSCHDLIQLILREDHPLADNPQVYLLRAQIAFEQSENLGEVMTWVQQAKLCKNKIPDTQYWDLFVEALIAFKEGDYQLGEKIMEALIDEPSVSTLVRYKLAYHYFWKNINTERALYLLEELCVERPQMLQAKSCLGFIYNKLGLKAQAQSAFSYCLERETDPERIAFYKQQLAS